MTGLATPDRRPYTAQKAEVTVTTETTPQALPRRTESGMQTRAVNAAAGVLLAAMQQGRQTPTGLALALDAAQLLNSPEAAAEFEKLLRWHREAIAKLVARIERHRARLVKAEADLLEMRGLLSPNGEPRRIPAEVEIHERVAPAVEWLLNRVAELESRLAEYERPADEDPIRYTLTAAAEAIEDPHDSPLHHDYLIGRDLPEVQL